ncbi:glycosyltransferase family 2 protein [Ancylobacter terrae]|uniref:glycosyltransferase family 2 protein n=1 Tax=Ancylobacter sp. sgz301288 TaxID=3342077 RepID=UPI00385CD0F3
MRIAAGIATTGRRDVLTETVRELSRQTRVPDKVFICAVKPEDVDAAALSTLGIPVDIHLGRPGSSAQRNDIIDRTGDFDLIAFFDDDFFPQRDFLALTEAIFDADPRIVMLTGNVLVDGARGAGVEIEDARRINAAATPEASLVVSDVPGAYGCNMVLRRQASVANGLRFDEDMPLYGWMEDFELSRRLSAHGRIVRSEATRGVHLAIKRGRTSGLRYGYSQVANPVYIYRKGLIPISMVISHAVKNTLVNLVRSVRPEPYIDRRGRLRGNLRAIADLLRGRLHPKMILSM